ncbi:MAG: hypothetical protein IT319_16770 [Anaerolineae bacterium]|nr:hypothetical protein [Anaerolineae bacterium]
MTRQRIQLWLAPFCIGLLGITSFSTSAQEFPEPEDDTERIRSMLFFPVDPVTR